MTNEEYVRALIDDTQIGGASEEFSDNDITDHITRAGSNLFLAASTIWRIKAGRYARRLNRESDIPEKRRNYVQLYQNARQMAEDYASIAATSNGHEELVLGITGSKALNLREPPYTEKYTWPE